MPGLCQIISRAAWYLPKLTRANIHFVATISMIDLTWPAVQNCCVRDEKDKTFLGAISLVAQHFFFLSFSNIFPFDLSNFSTSDLLTIFDGSQSVVVPKSHFIYRRGRERERKSKCKTEKKFRSWYYEKHPRPRAGNACMNE